MDKKQAVVELIELYDTIEKLSNENEALKKSLTNKDPKQEEEEDRDLLYVVKGIVAEELFESAYNIPHVISEKDPSVILSFDEWVSLIDGYALGNYGIGSQLVKVASVNRIAKFFSEQFKKLYDKKVEEAKKRIEKTNETPTEAK